MTLFLIGFLSASVLWGSYLVWVEHRTQALFERLRRDYHNRGYNSALADHNLKKPVKPNAR